MLCEMSATGTVKNAAKAEAEGLAAASRPETSENGTAGTRGSAGPAPGSRLAEAFEAVERFPVLIESRERVIAAATADNARIGELVEVVEADVALSISVLRFANRPGMAG